MSLNAGRICLIYEQYQLFKVKVNFLDCRGVLFVKSGHSSVFFCIEFIIVKIFETMYLSTLLIKVFEWISMFKSLLN